MIFTLLAPLIGAALVSAHGQVSSVSSGGVTNEGPNIYYSADSRNSGTAIRTMYKASSPAYVLSGDFNNNAKMSCEEASGAPSLLKVAAGDSVTVQWVGSTSELLNQPGTGTTSDNPWVHAMGPIMDYIAECDGDCSSYDATSASWVKLAEFGIDNSQSISSDLRQTMTNKPEPYYPKGSGLWGMAKLVQDGSQWTINIPSVLKDGQYILRHELSAMHSNKVSGSSTSGPQNYIACIQIEVTGGGSTSLPEGTLAGSLYDTNGDYANFNVYSSDNAAQSFVVPGPAVWDQASSGSSSSTSGSSSGSTSSGSSSSGDSSDSSDDSTTTAESAPTTTSEAAAATTPIQQAATSTSAAAESTTSSVNGQTCRKRKRRSLSSSSSHRRNLKKRLSPESF